MSERREHARWEGHFLVELEGDPEHRSFEAVGLNVSTGGLCLIFPDEPAPQVGDVYGVIFRLPNMNEDVENAVVIRWVDRERSKVCGGAFVRGLRAREAHAIGELLRD